ncbi:DUF3048 domain-containing protein [Georgenia alba]|uniref:DUF3048 domain-containing protein n=1 Tax=Georgenia alba TaxID=2233858 RepID=A0ABW2QE47_9MICO
MTHNPVGQPPDEPQHDDRTRPDAFPGMPRRRAVAAGLVSVVALGIAGCDEGSRRSAPVDRGYQVPDGDAATGSGPSASASAPRWPLTGALIDGRPTPRPALSVKIENSDDARPQSGLEDADLVFEQMVEGGTTRFNAVFHSVMPGTMGPIRSIRPMDAAISGQFGGLLAFSGGQGAYVRRAIQAGLQVMSLDAGSPGFYRAGHRYAPHNVYGRPRAFLRAANGSPESPSNDILEFAREADGATAADHGERAGTVRVSFPSANPGWRWTPDARTGRGVGAGAWRRTEDGAAQSSEDGKAVLASNVVVLRVQVEMTGARDAAGAQVPETILQGEGDAVVFSRGRAVEAAWSKGGPTRPMQLTRGGEPVLLAPGPTWIELLPVSGGSLSF